MSTDSLVTAQLACGAAFIKDSLLFRASLNRRALHLASEQGHRITRLAKHLGLPAESGAFDVVFHPGLSRFDEARYVGRRHELVILGSYPRVA